QQQGMIGDRLNLVRRFQNPAFTPCVDDPVLCRRRRDEVKRHLKNDGIDVLACLTILATIYKAEIAVFVFAEFVAAPGQRTRRQITFMTAISPLWIVRVEIK